MNPIQAFLAARAAKSPAKPITNADTPVTRDEFNTLTRAVHALIEDFDAVASPDKLKAVINSAFQAVANEAAPPAPGFIAPLGDERGVMPPRLTTRPMLANAKPAFRAPLALKPE